VVRRLHANPVYGASYIAMYMPSNPLRPITVLHRMAFVLYGIVQHGGTYEAPVQAHS
jgi:hypothetical protein